MVLQGTISYIKGGPLLFIPVFSLYVIFPANFNLILSCYVICTFVSCLKLFSSQTGIHEHK